MNMFFDDTTDYDHNQSVYRIQIPCLYEIKKKKILHHALVVLPERFTRIVYMIILANAYFLCLM